MNTTTLLVACESLNATSAASEAECFTGGGPLCVNDDKRTWNIVGVLGAAYPKGRLNKSAFLTHLEVPGTNSAPCGRVGAGHLGDVYGSEDYEIVNGEADSSYNATGKHPTCPRCAALLVKAIG